MGHINNLELVHNDLNSSRRLIAEENPIVEDPYSSNWNKDKLGSKVRAHGWTRDRDNTQEIKLIIQSTVDISSADKR